MPGNSEYVITPSDRTTLLRGPLGAVLMLAGDRTGGRLSLVEHPLEPRAPEEPHRHDHQRCLAWFLEPCARGPRASADGA
jgi:hypothetical protein